MPPRVLIVDDDIGIQHTVQGILESEGYEVLAAGDGEEALAKLDGFAPAVILLDIGLPRLDGFGFAAELRRQECYRGLPIVVLTADGRARQKAQQVGATSYLHKPFSVDALLSATASALVQAVHQDGHEADSGAAS